ncbi:8301_t:CDS:1, partial [Racocetra fulgida]
LQFELTEQSELLDQFDHVEYVKQSEQSNSNKIYNTFVENSVNAPAILIKELIPPTK